ncbi:MAG: hypothetical protein AAF829_02260 [Pseudomonadota bacterium]
MRSCIGTLIASLAMAAGCQTVTDEAVPAVLADDAPETMDRLKAGLAEAVGRANIELGAGDPTQTSTITILPPAPSPLETASVAMPTPFRLMMRGDTCMAVHGETGEEFAMDLPCTPVSD